MRWHKWLTTCTGAPPQSKDALVACQKFCTMQNQQSKQRSTPHFQKTQRFIDRLKQRNNPPQQVVGKRHYQIYLFYAIKYLLPIVLFVGQHFSGSLFHLITLLLFTRETTKGTRARELGAPSPYPLGFLPRGSLFPYSHPHPVGALAELVKLPEHCISCKFRNA